MEKKEMVTLLVDKGFIDKAIFYRDKNGLIDRIKSLELSEEKKLYAELLSKLLVDPILIDSIEELVTNHKRNEIRKELHSISPEIYSFYESNKLQSSNVLNILVCVSRFVGDPELLPGYIFVDFKKIQKDSSGSEDILSMHDYKNYLNNEQKLEIVHRTTKLLEDFFQAVLRGEVI